MRRPPRGSSSRRPVRVADRLGAGWVEPADDDGAADEGWALGLVRVTAGARPTTSEACRAELEVQPDAPAASTVTATDSAAVRRRTAPRMRLDTTRNRRNPAPNRGVACTGRRVRFLLVCTVVCDWSPGEALRILA